MSPGQPVSAVAPEAQPASLAAELEQALVGHQLVVVCWEPGCTMHRLRHWRPDQWVSRPAEKGYAQYSHGICAWHYPRYQREIDRLLAVPPQLTTRHRAAVSGT
ncbi:MAG: hypothetical protein AB1505_28385 [Candidatus Latescibacterota bacterium]